jgi:hypothetical protein
MDVSYILCCQKDEINWIEFNCCQLLNLKQQSPSAAHCERTQNPTLRFAAMFWLSLSSVNCLVSQSAPFCSLPFCSTQFLHSSTHPNPKPDTLPHSVLLSTKWLEISVRWVIQRCLLSEWDEFYFYTGRNVGTDSFKWLYKAEVYWHQKKKWRHFRWFRETSWLNSCMCAASPHSSIRNLNKSEHF